ncbi:DUF2783 domain-containing protein [Chachezhania sediminis]|uniref:DUF2783 domain-containing protein n=1 Tax=Chachezhania sediminis TaxID=2599291 RepID=UPI00131B2499|nr:DUF2783 domain-containing protein [Chachezhania sediminis]
MTILTTTPNIPDGDGFYSDLIAAHDGLSDDESAALNARLILILANQIGDRAVLTAALDAARPKPR